jgi:hypothetical protein
MDYVRVFRRTDKSIVFETFSRNLYDDFVSWIVLDINFEEVADEELYPLRVEAGIKFRSGSQIFYFVLTKP